MDTNNFHNQANAGMDEMLLPRKEPRSGNPLEIISKYLKIVSLASIYTLWPCIAFGEVGLTLIEWSKEMLKEFVI